MFRLDTWKKVYGLAEPQGLPRRPSDTFWFTRRDLMAAYIDHLKAVDEHGMAYYWEISEGDPTPVVDPDPPEVSHLYTAVWQSGTGQTTVTAQMISPQRRAREPKVSTPVKHPTDPGLPLTSIKWGRQVAGQFDQISVFGTDKAAVEDALAAAVEEADRGGQLTAPDVLEAIAAQSGAEDEMYFKPISTLETELQAAMARPNFLGTLYGTAASVREKLFATRSELRPKYIAALAEARAEAGIGEGERDPAVDRALDRFSSYEERWERNRKAMPEAAGSDYVFPVPGVPGGVYMPPMGTPPPLFGIPGVVPGSAQDPLGLSTPLITPWRANDFREDFVTKSPIKAATELVAQFGGHTGALSGDGVKSWLVDAVRAERGNGRTWDEIASALGTTRQAAYQRFAKAVAEEPADVVDGEPISAVEDGVVGRFKAAVSEGDAVDVEELLQQALSDVLDKLAAVELFPTGFASNDAVGRYREFLAVARRYQDLVGPLVEMVAVGCQRAPEFEDLYVSVLTQLAQPHEPSPRVSSVHGAGELGPLPVTITETLNQRLLELAMLPAALVMYAGMIAALSAKQFGLVRALSDAQVPISWQRIDTVSAFQRLLPDLIIDQDDLEALYADQQSGRRISDDFLRRIDAGDFKTPRERFLGSSFMFGALQDRVMLAAGRFGELFDRTEMLLGLLIADAQSYPMSWVGRYAVSVADSPSFEFSIPGRYFTDAVVADDSWGPVKAGMFGGSTERVDRAVQRQVITIKRLTGYAR